MPTLLPQERRNTPRQETDGLMVEVRRKGRLVKLIGMAVDFNRYGVAIITDQPLAVDVTVYLSLCSSVGKIDNVMGVVHNCFAQQTGYRSGIQFRTSSLFQDEQSQIERKLSEMERDFVATSSKTD